MCRADRASGELGYCKAGADIKIAQAYLHKWEEPPISGENGSGTVFFTYCNMQCVFCQNYKISREHVGKTVTTDELSKIFLDLQGEGAHNINLVTPTHYIPEIKNALIIAKNSGLKIPVVYNSGGYENADTLRTLNGLIDIYLPDFKYYSDKYALRYSNAPNYRKIAISAIAEMFRQTGKNMFAENGLMKRGVIVRHMMLPGLLFDSKKIIDYLYKTYGDDIYISIMSQYTPIKIGKEFEELNRTVTKEYYDSLVDYAAGIGVRNAFVQDGTSVGESFIPEFFGK